MKLYYARGACSLADHIALLDAGETFEVEAVDLKAKVTETGRDFYDINPKGYVPALVLDDGQTLTEKVAVLDWIADRYPELRPAGPLGRTRLIETLTFISTEIHGAYKPMWHAGTEAEKAAARDKVAGRLRFIASCQKGDYLFGDQMSAADCYLYVMLSWAERFAVAVPDTLAALKRRMDQRASVRAALAREAPVAVA